MDSTEKPKKRPRGDKVSAGAIAARVDDILPLVTDGASIREVRAFVRGKTVWGNTVDDRTIGRYIARACRLIMERSEKSAEWYTAEAMARYQRLYLRASAKGDLSECRQIQAEIIRLRGLAKPERRIIVLEDFDNEIERLERLDAELARSATEK